MNPRNVQLTKLSVRKAIWGSQHIPECNITSTRGSFKANSFKMDELPNQPLKKFNNNFDKISLLFQTVFESGVRSLLPTVHLDFSWTLEMSDRQNDQLARPFQSLSSSPVTTWHHLKTLSRLIHCTLSKFILHSLTASASWPKASRLSPTVQLYFSWTLEMSNQQNDSFARSSEGLSISSSATLNHPEALSKLILLKWISFRSNH